MLADGDIDALENQQLEAERTVRRFRVERQVLEAALPDAIQKEAAKDIAVMMPEVDGDLESLEKAVATLEKALEEAQAAIEQLDNLDMKCRKIYQRAIKLQHSSGLSLSVVKPFGRLTSNKLRNLEAQVPSLFQGMKSNLTMHSASASYYTESAQNIDL